MKIPKYKLSILIPSLSTRTHYLTSLLSVLNQQMTEEVEILILIDNGVKNIGKKRNELLKQSQGEYIVFIDDDDSVAYSFVDDVLEATKTGVDYISYGQCFHNVQTKEKKDVISHIGAKWENLPELAVRGVMHVCPTRRELALQVKFPEAQQYGEDVVWGKEMDKVCKTEYLINKMLYYYEWRRIKTD